MGWKRFIIGDKMPDKADPQYKERYEKEVNAGRRFARWSHIDTLAARIQRWATGHERAFLCIVFSIVIFCFAWNMIGIMRVVNAPPVRQQSVSERQEHLLDSLKKEKVQMDVPRSEQKAVEPLTKEEYEPKTD